MTHKSHSLAFTKSRKLRHNLFIRRPFMLARPWSLPEREMSVKEPDTVQSPDMELTLRVRGCVDSTVTVRSTDTPFSLCDSTAHGPVRFIHKGRLVCPAMSFAFLGIADGDEIFVVGEPKKEDTPPESRPDTTFNFDVRRLKKRFDEKWADKFKDPEAVFEQLRSQRDPLTARESARLTDLFRARIERNTSKFRRLYSRFSRMYDDGQVSQPSTRGDSEVTVVPEKALCPSTDLLPGMWLRSPSADVSRVNF